MIRLRAALASSLPSFVSSLLLRVHNSVTLGRIASTEVYTRENSRIASPCNFVLQATPQMMLLLEGPRF